MVSERALTIGFDGRYLQDASYGLGRYAYGLLTGLSSIEGNHKIIIFVNPALPNSMFPLDRLASCRNMELRNVSVPLFHPLEIPAWRVVLHRTPVDLFHAPYFLSPAALPCPVVATVHDMIYDHFPQFLPLWDNPLIRTGSLLMYRLTSRVALHRARRIIANSETTRLAISQVARVPSTKVAAIPLGIDSSFRPVEDKGELDRVRARYHLPEHYVLAVHGSRRPHKNVSRLVAAFGRIRSRCPHTLVLVGGPDRLYLDTAAGAIAAGKREGWLQEILRVAEADLPVVYSMADLLVHPSLYEGFGLPVLEAMACGCPVTTSNAGALPEVGGDAVLYFDPESEDAMAETMLRLLCSGTLREALRRHGLQRARTFSWERAAADTLAVYHDVAA